MILSQLLMVETGENGPDGDKQRRPPMTGGDVVTTTVHTSSRHRHTTMAYPPWSKRDAAPQSDDEFDFTSFDTEIEESEEVNILEMEETDN
jgi:hypothetical protein